MKALFFIILLALAATCHGQKDYRWKFMKGTDLNFIKKDVTRTGKVVKVYGEADGDLHIWLQTKKELIVCEVICYKQVPICGGYKNSIPKPRAGDYIKVKGDLVYDKKHKWNELHPVKKIEYK